MITTERKQWCQTPRPGWGGPGEDDIIDSILGPLGLLRAGQVAVDVGAWDGFYLSNTRHLKELYGFGLILFDGDGRGNPEIIQAMVRPDNVGQLFVAHNVPDEPALLSIDIDSFDYWLRKAITIRPACIVMEFNGTLDPLIPVTVPYDPDGKVWKEGDGNHFGASWSAIKNLNESMGYRYVTQCACLNAFFVRDDLARADMPWNATPPKVAKYHRQVEGPWERV